MSEDAVQMELDEEPFEVHPVAAMFPMMPDEELDDLAADISANGLIHPIVLGPNGEIVDGRNRMEGCIRAGVEPTFTTLEEGQDPVAFILSANVTRRHLSKGQQAMAVARACLLSKQTMRGAASSTGVSAARISQATTILDYAPDLADGVLFGAVPLNEAYEEARRRKVAAESDESKFLGLQAAYPDLAVQVQEGTLPLDEAMAAAKARKERLEREEQERVEGIRRLSSRFHGMLTALEKPEKMDPEAWAATWLTADASVLGDAADFSAERAERAADTLLQYARLKREKEKASE